MIGQTQFLHPSAKSVTNSHSVLKKVFLLFSSSISCARRINKQLYNMHYVTAIKTYIDKQTTTSELTTVVQQAICQEP